VIFCISVETAIALNRQHTENDGLLRDRAVLEGALGRPMATFDRVDLYPTVLQKAAVLLHGLGRTQSFIDGSKRTAWMSCVTFLGDRGLLLGDVDDIAADFVLAPATNEIDVPEAVDWILDHLRN
jgi:death on curing protein